jgi:hypothetical protein
MRAFVIGFEIGQEAERDHIVKVLGRVADDYLKDKLLLEAGMVEQKNQIVDKVDKFVKDVDWLKEDPYTRKDIVEAIKNHEPEKELVGWED